MRPTTKADLLEIYGVIKFPTLIARTLVVNGKPAGCFGVSKVEGKWQVFVDVKAEARAHKFWVVREGKKMLRYLEHVVGIKCMYAVADFSEPTAHRWLTNEGFTPLRGDIYVRE